MAEMKPQKLPLVVTADNRNSSTSKDARLVNGYVEQTPEGVMCTVRRQGLVKSSTVAAGTAGHGIYQWNGNVYSIFGGNLYKDGVLVGAIDATAGKQYCFSACLGATPKLFFHNTVAAYTYDSGGGLVHIVDANFPAGLVKGAAYLDGIMYVMTATANISASDVNFTAPWTSNVIVAQIEHDQGVCLAKQLVYVIAFKQWSTEVFYDAGNPTGSPLAAVQGAKVSYGCRHADSVQDMDGVLFWITATRAGSVGVGKLDSLKFSAISTPAIDRLLQAADYTTVYSWNVKIDGHKFYGVTLVNSGLTLVYDDSTSTWAHWTDPAASYLSISNSTYSITYQPLLQDASDGNIYTLSSSTYIDDGVLFPVDIYTPNWDAGEQVIKTISRMHVRADQQEGSQIIVRWSDDDYQTWSQPITIDLNQKNPMLTNIGSFRKRAFHFRHNCNTAFRIREVEMNGLLGSL